MPYLWTVRRKGRVVAVIRDRDYGGLRPSQPDLNQLAECLNARDRACLERRSGPPWFTTGQDGHCYLNPLSSRLRRLDPYYFYRFEHEPQANAA